MIEYAIYCPLISKLKEELQKVLDGIEVEILDFFCLGTYSYWQGVNI
jgi:hypothetical protein